MVAARTSIVALGVLVGVLVLGASEAAAQPPETSTPREASASEMLREGNAAALAGDWPRVALVVDPLLQRELSTPDLGEAHRLAGLAAFFQQRADAAERHFLAYLRIEIDGRLDPALYPPDAVAFFNDVASRHGAELRALRVRPSRSWVKTLLPPLGQFQNGDRTKGYVLGVALGAALVTNLATYTYLRAWCNHTDGSAGGVLTCDEDGGDHTDAAKRLRPLNIGSGIAFAVIYIYGVYDGIRGYRRRTREHAIQPFMNVSRSENVLGIGGRF
jgi:hypothetical protein